MAWLVSAWGDADGLDLDPISENEDSNSIEVLERGNETPGGFQVTSRYLVIHAEVE